MTIAQLIDELRRHNRNLEVLINEESHIESITYRFTAGEGVTYVSLNTFSKEDDK